MLQYNVQLHKNKLVMSKSSHTSKENTVLEWKMGNRWEVWELTGNYEIWQYGKWHGSMGSVRGNGKWQ